MASAFRSRLIRFSFIAAFMGCGQSAAPPATSSTIPTDAPASQGSIDPTPVLPIPDAPTTESAEQPAAQIKPIPDDAPSEPAANPQK